MKIHLQLLAIFLLLLGFNSTAQCDTSRYRSPIFNAVYKTENVLYSEAQVWNIPYNNTDLFMDIYEPMGDSQAKRPLMIWLHPGGFLTGDKSADDMVALCDSFAKRGYVTVSIGYRLGFNPLSSSSAERAVYRGTQDLRAAIRYLYEFSDVYDIDTNYTFVGGSSAGAVAAVHAVYIDQDEVPSSISGSFGVPDLGCLDCSGNSYNHAVDIDGYVNLWGALGDSSWIDSDEDTPGLLIHGDQDAVVPFGVGNPFGVFTTPIVHGSRAIHNQLDMYGIDHTFLPFYGQGHEPHGASNGTFANPPNAYWDTIFNAINDHYLSLVLPEIPVLAGDQVVCENDIETYSLILDTNEVGCWDVFSGQIIDDFGDSIRVQWTMSGVGEVRYHAVNEISAVSSMGVTSVQINPLPVSAGFSHSIVNNISEFSSNASGSFVNSWDFGDGTSDVGDLVSHAYVNAGIYNVVLTISDPNGCTASSDSLIYFTFSGLDEVANTNNVVVYPNPATEYLHIQSDLGEGEIKIVSLAGNVVLESTLRSSDEVVYVGGLMNGIYLVIVTADEHKTVQRVVISK